MARLIKTVVNSSVRCRIDTTFDSGAVTTREIAVGDEIEGLRYVLGDQVKFVSGIVKAINYTVKQVGRTADSNTDITLTTIVIDASEKYQSNIVTIKCKEIVENEGVENVVHVWAYAKVVVDLDLTYSNNFTDKQSIEAGDSLDNMTIMGDKPGAADITGKFKVKGFTYTKMASNRVKITGLELANENNVVKKYSFSRIISFKEVFTLELKSSNGLADLAAAINDNDEVEMKLVTDTTVPPRDDGRITTVFIPTGKTVSIDLNSHSINTSAYAFYITGGTLVIEDNSKEKSGAINCKMRNVTYPAVYVNQGTCIMNSGLIDTTDPEFLAGEGENWQYGMVCANDGTFIMNGGTIHTDAASCISITNGTADGEGASFIIGGKSKLITDNCAAIYLADNKNVIVKDNAECGSIIARMGNVEVLDNAKVVNNMNPDIMYNLVDFCKQSGVEAMQGAITGMLGCYKTNTENNDFNLKIAKTARVTSNNGPAIELVKIENKYDQIANVVVDTENSLKSKVGFDKIKVYEHDELAHMAWEQDKTFPDKASTVTLSVKVAGVDVYTTPETTNEEEG